MTETERTARYTLRALAREDRNWVAAKLDALWGSTRVISRGEVYYAHTLPGLTVTDPDGQPLGLLTYHLSGGDCQVVTLDSFQPGIGVASALLAALCEVAQDAGCTRVWLVTTNDNLAALGFYQRRGFSLVTVHRGAVERARKLKPQIPIYGQNNIPIRDEIELEVRLNRPA